MIGEEIRKTRESLKAGDRRYSLRQVAMRVGIEPAYLSKIERNEVPPPGEETIKKLSQELALDSDVMLAMAGKVSTDLQEIIRKRPLLFSKVLRALKEAPDHAILDVVREVSDGDW